jgi:hypothetical protein
MCHQCNPCFTHWGDFLATTHRSAQARLTMATNRAPLVLRILPSRTARLTRLNSSKIMPFGTVAARCRQYPSLSAPVEGRGEFGPATSGLRARSSSAERAPTTYLESRRPPFGGPRDACLVTSSRAWSGRRGSNPRQPAWKAGALPLSYSRPLAARHTPPLRE